MKQVVLSFVGEDRAGLVRDLADIVAEYGGTWQESRMIRLDGQFAGLARVVFPTEAASIGEQLQSRSTPAMQIVVTEIRDVASVERKRYAFDLVGPDRPGIIFETTRELAEHQANIIEMSSSVSPAPMSGTPMFACSGIVEVSVDRSLPEPADWALGDVLSVDFNIVETADDAASG
ncbi:MAG: ACT domain-containing protein [Pseudomonadota bacterium]